MINKLAKGLCLTILVAFGASGVTLAKGTTTTQPTSKGEPVKTQNARQKTSHADRKAAAAHLKSVYKQQFQQHLKDEAKSHKGYSGLGKRGRK